MDGHQVPQTLVTEVGEVFESLLEEVSVSLMFIYYELHSVFSYQEHNTTFPILLYPVTNSAGTDSFLFLLMSSHFVDVIQTKKLRDEHPDDMSVLKAFKLVLDRRPDLR
jgi:hypothetical protein